ncbi:uncharacterized protein MONOS_11431 [Monocercomonoides exilis]|uniref:uncharacterized protein n=1 Tax=Monocercomonoides exilis TaxID=2049356 RepID=UPI00355ABA1D|nr:hypothetical protein MONOS_11431 [Monocercomonoides exilis]|eukprot:MONOS_11431.1-p1 / transcript=MONOS_11431.1 / gene=MONOS_11431 / organism=Monocercomonoides_exilis_PA203 / gene_product=unspecified product / transcript_product=unspecified product / location=Mono_scaffold00573:31524-31796(+) / protein_length=91 / sequence_SO=supercontig / SO=protein_coding / is_pseudo=false
MAALSSAVATDAASAQTTTACVAPEAHVLIKTFLVPATQTLHSSITPSPSTPPTKAPHLPQTPLPSIHQEKSQTTPSLPCLCFLLNVQEA